MKKKAMLVAGTLAATSVLCFWYFTRITEVELDNIREVACRQLFENASPGFAPGNSPDWDYFAVSLEGRKAPNRLFLNRFEDVHPKVLAAAEANKREPKDVIQTKGMYVAIESIERAGLRSVVVKAYVGCGWAAAVYEVVVIPTWTGWKCKTLRQTAVS